MLKIYRIMTTIINKQEKTKSYYFKVKDNKNQLNKLEQARRIKSHYIETRENIKNIKIDIGTVDDDFVLNQYTFRFKVYFVSL